MRTISLLRVFHGIRFYFKGSGTVKSRFSAFLEFPLEVFAYQIYKTDSQIIKILVFLSFLLKK